MTNIIKSNGTRQRRRRTPCCTETSATNSAKTRATHCVKVHATNSVETSATDSAKIDATHSVKTDATHSVKIDATHSVKSRATHRATHATDGVQTTQRATHFEKMRALRTGISSNRCVKPRHAATSQR